MTAGEVLNSDSKSDFESELETEGGGSINMLTHIGELLGLLDRLRHAPVSECCPRGKLRHNWSTHGRYRAKRPHDLKTVSPCNRVIYFRDVHVPLTALAKKLFCNACREYSLEQLDEIARIFVTDQKNIRIE